MKLSVISCFHNSRLRIPAYARALGELDFSGLETEVILVDNASKDSTRADLERLARDSPVATKVILEERPGLMYARCAGIAVASGDYAVFFDDDNEPRVDYLRALDGLIRRYPEAQAFTGNAVLPADYAEEIRLGDALALLAVRQKEGEKLLSLRTLAPQPMVLGAGMAVPVGPMRDACAAWLAGSRQIVGRQGAQPTGGEELWLIHYITRNGGYAIFSDKLHLIHRVDRDRLTASYMSKIGFEYGRGTPELLREIRRFKPRLRSPYPRGIVGIGIATVRVVIAAIAFAVRPRSRRLAILSHRLGVLLGLAQHEVRQYS